MRRLFVSLLISVVVAGPAYPQVSKEDCSALQSSLLEISIEMKRFQDTVRTGTEQTWMGSLPVAEKAALGEVRDARLQLVAALDEYIIASQDAAVALTTCTR